MSDLNAKIVADLKRELAEARAEIEQQRTRAEAAEQELRDYTAHVAQSKNEDRSKLAAIRAHLAGVDLVDLDIAVDESARPLSAFCRPVRHLLAAAREALEP